MHSATFKVLGRCEIKREGLRGWDEIYASTWRILVSIGEPAFLMNWRKLCTIISDVRVLPPTSTGMISYIPLKFTTLARPADVSFVGFMTILGSSTNRLLMRGINNRSLRRIVVT